MRVKINNRVYDTETAKKVGCYVDDYNHITRTLYVKRNGEKFIHYLNPLWRSKSEGDCLSDNYEMVGSANEMILPTKDDKIFDEWMGKSEARKSYLEDCLTRYKKSGGYFIWELEYSTYYADIA